MVIRKAAFLIKSQIPGRSPGCTDQKNRTGRQAVFDLLHQCPAHSSALPRLFHRQIFNFPRSAGHRTISNQTNRFTLFHRRENYALRQIPINHGFVRVRQQQKLQMLFGIVTNEKIHQTPLSFYMIWILGYCTIKTGEKKAMKHAISPIRFKA